MKDDVRDREYSQEDELPESILEAIVGGAGKGDTQDPPPK